MKKEQKKHLEKINTLLRYWILDMTTSAGSGHPTSSLSAVELMSTLFFGGVFRYDIHDPQYVNNDRLIFSKGHASPLYYALWAAARGINAGDLYTYRQFDSNLEGHPTMDFPFTEAPTGSLGQGLSVGVGVAIAQKILDQSQARTFVLLGDSEMAEGQVWEAMQIAAHYKLGNLVAIVDVNRLGQRGETMTGHDVATYAKRAQAFGWRTVIVHGHDIAEIDRVYRDVICDGKKPLMIIAKTLKGHGVSFLEDKYSWHGKVLSKEELMEAIVELGHVDFDVRGDIAPPKNSIIRHGENSAMKQNEQKFSILTIDRHKKYSTRDVYGQVLVELMRGDQKIVVLDAEVSNSTCAEIVKNYYPERFFEMYIAEQNMVSVAVGLARRGYRPFVSTFSAFLTRAHDQIRMAQYSGARITITGSHAGVSIGADGASQMGLEDVAMMRCMTNSSIFYPSDAVSARQHILQAYHTDGISYIRTTREKTPVIHHVPTDTIDDMIVLRSGLVDHIAVVGSGIATHEALKAYEMLQHVHMNIRVVDLLTIKPFDMEKFLQKIDHIEHVIIVEDHYREGGIGEMMITALRDHNLHIVHLAVDRMPHSGTPEQLLSYEKIDVHAIIDEVKKIYKKI